MSGQLQRTSRSVLMLTFAFFAAPRAVIHSHRELSGDHYLTCVVASRVEVCGLGTYNGGCM